LFVADLPELTATRLAKLSFAGVAGFEGALKGLFRAADPDGCAERGVERPESWGVGFWRNGGKFDGGFGVGVCLLGADQSRFARSSISRARRVLSGVIGYMFHTVVESVVISLRYAQL
jgi:hypothetical protein